MRLLSGSPALQENIYLNIWNPRRYFTWGLGIQDHGDVQVPVDDIMPLLGEGQLCIFAGSEGSGKTTWSIEMAKQNALLSLGQYKVGYLSLEVDPYRIVSRYAERKIGLTRFERRDGISDPAEQETRQIASKEAISEFLETGLCLFPQLEDKEESSSIQSIASLCADPYGPSLLFIDNLAEITCDQQIKDEYSKYDFVVRELLRICRETKTTIVLLHHLGKPKMGEKLTINSIKGNNIILTKADIVVAIDKHLEPNFNWVCPQKDKDGQFVTAKTIAAFKNLAPRVEVRGVEVFKDRDWDLRGQMGFLKLTDGVLQCLSTREAKEAYPFKFHELPYYQAMLQEYNL